MRPHPCKTPVFCNTLSRPTRRPGRLAWLATALLATAWAPAWADDTPLAPTVLQVGPTRAIRTLAEAARLAVHGSRIEVDAGDYRRDTAVWPQHRLQLQAVGGRVRLLADGAAAQGKGIFVILGDGVSVEGFDFVGAQVPSLNGAGIRLQSGSLRVRDCRFLDNESGILTGNDPATELDVEASEFGHQRRADGYNHHLYAGTIARLRVERSYFHHAAGGHLLKSRAAINQIVDNRLIDGDGGQASYELEFPNGGQATVEGNVIAQSSTTENPVMVSFGVEGYRSGPQSLRLLHNTLVNPLTGAAPWVRVSPANPPGAVQLTMLHNLWVGAVDGTVLDNTGLDLAGSPATTGTNLAVALADLEDPAHGDYRLRRSARAASPSAPGAAQAARP